MKILVNAASAHMGGAVTYLQNLINWASGNSSDDRLVIVLPSTTRGKLRIDAASNRVELVDYPYENTGGLRRLYFDQVVIPRLLRSTAADVLFSSTGFGTWRSPRPQVLLVRNLAYFDPEFHARYRALGRSLRKNTARRWLSLLSMAASNVVVFPTRAMMELVREKYGPKNARMTANPYGYDRDALSSGDSSIPPWKDRLEDMKKQGYALLLNVSTYAVQKNLETAVEALSVLAGKGLKVRLVTTTSMDKTTDKAEYDAMRTRVKHLGLEEDLVEIGYVPYQQLGLLYELADYYLFPSITESFGHSMVEAMANGLPVIAADTPVNREICASAGTYFDRYDPAHLAARVERLLQNPEKRRNLSTLSKERALMFSWPRHFETLRSLFEEISGKIPHPA